MIRSFHKLSPIALVAVAASQLVACGGSDSSTPGGTGKTYTFAFIPKDQQNETFFPGIAGAKARATALTAAGPDTVNVVISGASGGVMNSAAIETMAVQTAISDKVDGIVISAQDATLVPAIDSAVAAGIPVMTFDSDAAGSKRFAYYAINSLAAATAAANLGLMSTALKSAPNKKYAIISGITATSGNLLDRINGFKVAMTTAGWTLSGPGGTSGMGIYDGKDQTDGNVAARVEQALADTPDLSVMLMTGAWPFRCVPAAPPATGFTPAGCTAAYTDEMPNWKKASAAHTLTTIIVAGTLEEEKAVGDGLVQVVAAQNLWGNGYDTIGDMYGYIKGTFKPPTTNNGYIDSGFSTVCANNVSEALAAWSANNFSAPLTPCALP